MTKKEILYEPKLKIAAGAIFWPFVHCHIKKTGINLPCVNMSKTQRRRQRERNKPFGPTWWSSIGGVVIVVEEGDKSQLKYWKLAAITDKLPLNLYIMLEWNYVVFEVFVVEEIQTRARRINFNCP